MIRRFERLSPTVSGLDWSTTAATDSNPTWIHISVSGGGLPEIQPDLKRQMGEGAGAAPKITNNQVWPPTEPPLAEGIRKREVLLWNNP